MNVETAKPKESQHTLNLEKMIKWEPLLDLHVRGSCSRGAVWIRLDREAKVTGLYFMFGAVEKMVPRTEHEETLSEAKRWAEEQVQLLDWAEELSKKEQRPV
jgi:hypothetical protein